MQKSNCDINRQVTDFPISKALHDNNFKCSTNTGFWERFLTRTKFTEDQTAEVNDVIWVPYVYDMFDTETVKAYSCFDLLTWFQKNNIQIFSLLVEEVDTECGENSLKTGFTAIDQGENGLFEQSSLDPQNALGLAILEILKKKEIKIEN